MTQEEFDRYALAPEVESERLRALDQLHLSDAAEDRFARITRMARVALGVPMSAINLVDRDRQWCKQFSADHELDFDVPRDQSVCRATIARAYEDHDDPALIFADLSAEPEFAELPAIAAEGGVRFYAGFPLFGPGGHPVGTFCVYDTEPRGLSVKDRATFGELAAWAQEEVQSSDDVQRAAEVQRQLLPAPLGEVPGYTVATLFEPAFAVAGDFYDHHRVAAGLSLTVADVMGKGLGAAILAAGFRSALRGASTAFDQSGQRLDLSAVVGSVAAQLAEDLERTGTFVTVFHASLDLESGRVAYVDAGHGIAALLRKAGDLVVLDSSDLPVGINFEDTWTAHDVVMGPGDVLVLASDGLLDLLADDAGPEDAFAFLARHRQPSELCSAVRSLMAARLLTDDVTVVAVRRDEEWGT